MRRPVVPSILARADKWFPGAMAALLSSVVLTPAFAQSDTGSGAEGFPLRLERAIGPAAGGEEQARPVFASGDSVSGSPDGVTIIEGSAQIRRGGMLVNSDRIEYNPETEMLKADGQVSISQAGSIFSGPRLRLNLATNIGRFERPDYQLVTNGGRGSALIVEFDGPDKIRLKDSTYTTCECGEEDWYLKSDTLLLDNEAKEGQGRGASLYFKGVRVFRLPLFWFPLSDQRRTGFLSPSLAITSSTGAEVAAPFYWNLAPNRDATLTPRIMSKRGVQLGADFRYLESAYSGELRSEYTPNDRLTGHQRYQWSWRHTIERLGGWRGGLYINGISDDNYFVDYGRSIIATSERNLPRDAFLTRGFGNWNVLLRATQYRSILDARDAPPYQRLPQVRVRNTTRGFHGFDASTELDATYFTRRLAGSEEGLRLVANPKVSYPMLRPGSFIVPQIGLHLSTYRLDPLETNESRTVSRVVPTFSLDAGLIFERDAAWLGTPVIQTLEPRLYYSYTPYTDQSDIPVFDTGPTEFGFAQLFSPNVFVGDDRIADVNQITAALLTRIIMPKTGAERIRLAVAQRLNFGNQRVTIPGFQRRTDRRSDVLLAASGDLGGGSSFDSGVQLSLADSRVPRFNFSWRYRPATRRVFNVGARFQRDELGQIDTSFQWPLGGRWTALGRINYSWIDQRINESGTLESTRPGIIESVFGLQYSTECWASRFVVQRFATAQDERTTAFFIQMELTGVARIGTDPFAILKRNIPGYRVPGEQSVNQDPFNFYQ
ncbi:MAG: LPS-assembly protein LptD [Burkholderiaceae bacterium]